MMCFNKSTLSLACIVIAILLNLPSLGDESRRQQDYTTIAVIPFENIKNESQVEWLRYGIAEALCTHLANISSLRLVERIRLSILQPKSSTACIENPA